MMVLGRTGKGKTTAALQILNARCNQRDATGLVIETKARDDGLTDTGWPIISSWPPSFEQREGQRVILWPPYRKSSNRVAEAKPAIVDALDEIMLEGAWTVYIDETNYLVENFNMRAQLDEFWQGGRSSRITLMAGGQRPVWLNRGMRSQATYAVVFHIGDKEDRQSAADALGEREIFVPLIASLRDHECLVMDTETGKGVRTIVELEPLQIPEPRAPERRSLFRFSRS